MFQATASEPPSTRTLVKSAPAYFARSTHHGFKRPRHGIVSGSTRIKSTHWNAGRCSNDRARRGWTSGNSMVGEAGEYSAYRTVVRYAEKRVAGACMFAVSYGTTCFPRSRSRAQPLMSHCSCEPSPKTRKASPTIGPYKRPSSVLQSLNWWWIHQPLRLLCWSSTSSSIKLLRPNFWSRSQVSA